MGRKEDLLSFVNQIRIMDVHDHFPVNGRGYNENGNLFLPKPYADLIKKRCHIQKMMTHIPFSAIIKDTNPVSDTDERHLSPLIADITPFLAGYSTKAIREIAHFYGHPVHQLADLLEACEQYLRKAAAYDAVGFAWNITYCHSTRFERVAEKEAQFCFDHLFAGQDSCTALENYMTHFALAIIEELNLPLQIHNSCHHEQDQDLVQPANTDPERLVPLVIQYPGIRFDIFLMNTSFRYIYSALAHMYENVYIDLCDACIRTPDAAAACLSELLEAVPYNKLLVFGGDACTADDVAAHRCEALQMITETLAEKVENGLFDNEKAKEIAKALLYDNPSALYRTGEDD